MEGYTITIEEFIEQVKSVKTLQIIDKHKIPSTVRHEVWKRYVSEIYRKGKCFCCRTSDIEESNFDCGHVISRNNFGPISLQNLRPICGQCNRSMGTQNMDEFIVAYGFWKSPMNIKKKLSLRVCKHEGCLNTVENGVAWCEDCRQKERMLQRRGCTRDGCKNIVTNGFPLCDSCYGIKKDPFAKLNELLVTSSK